MLCFAQNTSLTQMLAAISCHLLANLVPARGRKLKSSGAIYHCTGWGWGLGTMTYQHSLLALPLPPASSSLPKHPLLPGPPLRPAGHWPPPPRLLLFPWLFSQHALAASLHVPPDLPHLTAVPQDRRPFLFQAQLWFHT